MEFAIVGTLLFTLLMGIIECGMLITNYMSLNTGVRETVRQIALRETFDATTLHDEVLENAPTLKSGDVSEVTQSYRVKTDGVWPQLWTPMPMPSDIDSSSTVQVKVSAKYEYKRLSSLIFKDPVVLSTELVMTRE